MTIRLAKQQREDNDQDNQTDPTTAISYMGWQEAGVSAEKRDQNEHEDNDK
jgi:hypothetical protein